MADKVLRFTAEDSGYGQTIDRMAAKLRGAFSNTGMADILQEADAKFTNFGDKIKYIKEQLSTLKDLNEGERQETVKGAVSENVRSGYKRSNDAVQKEVSRAYEKEEKAIDKLVNALDRFGEKFEDAVDKQQQPGEPPPVIIPGGGGGRGRGGRGGGGSFLEDAFTIAAGFGIEKIGEKLLGFITNSVKEGTDLARQQNVLQRQFGLSFDPLSDAGGRTRASAAMGVKNQEFLESLGLTAAGRGKGTLNEEGLIQETNRRFALSKAYGVTQDQFGGLDRFYRQRGDGSTLDRSGFDATRTIAEILDRAERQGILGVSKNDFTLLPEKIGQVTSIMTQQYGLGDRTDANAALNLILAGQRIGGRFADDRAADTFGKIGNSISNPTSPGTKAFLTEAVSRSNPGLTPLEIEAQLQNGLSEENIKAIFPLIQRTRSREMRGRIFQQAFGLDPQSALHMADANSIPALMNQMKVQGLDQTTLSTTQTSTQKRAEDLTLTLDKWSTYFSNSVTSFGEAVTKFVDGVTKGTVKAPELPSAPVIKSNAIKRAFLPNTITP